jgi:hypothetical protein
MTNKSDAASPLQLAILQHALGLDKYGQGTMHRNHFCAGGADEDICRELISLGYMQQHPTTAWLPYFNCSVTDAGKKAVRRDSPKPPKLTPGQQRYRAFLRSDCDLTFIEWLKYAARRKAEVL